MNVYHGGSACKKTWSNTGSVISELITLNFESQNHICEPSRFLLGVVDYPNNFYSLKGRYEMLGGGIHVSVSANDSNDVFEYPIDLCFYQLDYINPPTDRGIFNTITVNDVSVFHTVNLDLIPQRAGGEVYSVNRSWDSGNVEIGIDNEPLLVMVKTGNFIRPPNIYAIGIRVCFGLKKLHV
jgi:hypothetical protein